VTHFLGNDTGQVGFAVILLFFFYYFAVILLLGAEINSFFAEDIHATPDNVAVMVHQLTSHLPTSKKDIQEQATPTHKDEEPKDIRPKSEAKKLENRENQTNTNSESEHHFQPESFPVHEHIHPAPSNQTDHVQKKKRKSSAQGTSNVFITAEVLAGTALVIFVQFFQLRGKK
jgi:ABC-type Zn2+ transport system substrate-binding protein/surface adhesin